MGTSVATVHLHAWGDTVFHDDSTRTTLSTPLQLLPSANTCPPDPLTGI